MDTEVDTRDVLTSYRRRAMPYFYEVHQKF